MKPIKNCILLVFLLVSFNSCDDRKDAFGLYGDTEEYKEVFSTFTLTKTSCPEVFSQSLANSFLYSDTTKTGYTVTYKYSIDKDSLCTYNLIYDTDFAEFSISSASNTITYKGIKDGNAPVKIIISDMIGRQKEVLLNMTNKANQKPLPILDITHENLPNEKYRINFDASRSYDMDGYLGGKIERYEFTFEDQETIISYTSYYSVDVSYKGKYKVQIKVVDNDNSISAISKDYLIN